MRWQVVKNGSHKDWAAAWCRAMKNCQQIIFVKNCALYGGMWICFAEPDTIHVFKIYLGVFGEGTHLAMPKTICAPDSSSLKPGLGATEGVLD